MESDAKLGLLAGVAAVLVVAVVYYNKPLPATAADRASVPAITDRQPTIPPASVGVPTRPAKPVSRRLDDD